MISDRTKIDEALIWGRKTLSQRSDLKDLPLNQILDVLDDGTQEMLYNQWGVLAQVVIDAITTWETKGLVEYLAQIECPDLAYEFVGYELQNTHGVVLEELLIEAATCGHFDKIVKYVSPNLRYITIQNLQILSPFLQTLEKFCAHHSYHSILHCYAVGIAACDGFHEVITQLNPIKREVEYYLIYNIRRYWFSKKPDEANVQIGIFLNQHTIWAWKAALDYCEWNLPCDKTTFEKHYAQIDSLVDSNNELKIHVISLLVEYILQTAKEKENHQHYSIVLSKLKLLINQVPSVTTKFLQKLEYLNDFPDDIYAIFQDILSSPTNNSVDILKNIDGCLSSLLEKKDYQIVLDDMFKCFSANKYRANYLSFFDSLDSTLYALSKHAVDITDLALKYMTTSNVDQLFFGLGLFMKLGNIKSLYQKLIEGDPTYLGSYDEHYLIRIMKAILFYAADDTQISHTAFSLLFLAKNPVANYLTFCIESVFHDYPHKMNEISANYAESNLPVHKELVTLVNSAYASRAELQEKARAIPDLYPSHEHERLYRRAQQEQSREISKKANEMSIFNSLFARRVLKYGRRSGHVVKSAKDQQFYQASPYQEFRFEHHLPVTYVADPVEYSMRRYVFLKEVEDSASNN